MNILNSNALVPVGGAYENLVVSSVGLKFFNLLGSSSSSNRAGVSFDAADVSSAQAKPVAQEKHKSPLLLQRRQSQRWGRLSF